MNNHTQIYYVRHGQSEGNRGKIDDHVQGLGSSLTEKGIKQATELAEKFKNIQFDAIFSSTLARAIETAEIIKLNRKTNIHTTEKLRERNASEYLKRHHGKTRQDLEAVILDAVELLDDKKKLAYKYADYLESAEEGAVRILSCFKELAFKYPGKTLLVIGHGNTIRSTLTYLGWAKYDELPMNATENTGFIVLETDGKDFTVKDTYGIEKKQDTRRGW